MPVPPIRLFRSRPPTERPSRAAFYVGLAVALASLTVLTYLLYTIDSSTLYTKNFVSDEVYYASVAAKLSVYMFGYRGPVNISPSINPTYWNFEHPPLGKYIMALSIALLHTDSWIGYRLPEIIMTSLEPLIVYLAFAWPPTPSDDSIPRTVAGSVASIIFPLEHIVRVEGGIGLLDTVATFFVAISLALAMRRHYLAAATAAGLAVASKETAAPLALVLAIYYVVNERGKPRASPLKAASMILIPIAIFIASYVPEFIYFGVSNVLNGGLLLMMHWDLVSRPSGPTPSQPVDWLIGTSSMVLAYGLVSDKMVYVYASMTPTIELGAFAIAIYTVISRAVPRPRGPLDPASLFFIVEFLSFYAVYLKGNHTLYSMYSIIFVPASAMLWGLLAYSILRQLSPKAIRQPTPQPGQAAQSMSGPAQGLQG